MNEPQRDLPLKSPRRRARKLRMVAVFRWLHIYISMIGLASLLFFAWTGITLNHPTWFAASDARTRELSGQLASELNFVHKPGDGVDRHPIAEVLRARHGLRGRVTQFEVGEDEVVVLFKGPGYSADVLIDGRDKSYSVLESSYGLAGILNDLHKGRDTSRVWSLVIDISGGIMIAMSLTGFGLLFFLKRHRASGAAVAVVATIGLGVISFWFAI